MNMISTRRSHWLAIVVGVALTLNVTAKAADTDDLQLPSAREVLDGFHANRSKFKTLHVQFSVATEFTPAFVKWSNQHAGRLDALAAADTTTPGASRKQLREQAKRLRDFANSVLRMQTYLIEFLTDLHGFQFRMNQQRKPVELMKVNGWSFPRAEVTPVTLKTDFNTTHILSYSPLTNPHVRMWSGYSDLVGRTYGYLSDKPAAQLGHPYYFPPLLAGQKEWKAQLHPIDELFSHEPSTYHVSGFKMLDGRRLVVLDNIRTAVVPVSPEANIVRKDRTRTLIDPAQGYLPVVCECATQMVSDEGKSSGEWLVSKQMRIPRIAAVKGAGFYPLEFVVETNGLDPESTAVTLDEQMRAKQVVHERAAWTFDLVEVSPKLSDEFFVFQFPSDIPLYDYDANKTIGALEPASPIRLGTKAPPIRVQKWLDGEHRTLADLRGQVVVLEFWGLWCGACRNSVPAFQKLQEQYRDKPVIFLSLHTADGNLARIEEQISDFCKEQNWQTTVGIETGSMIENSATSHDYGVFGYPTTILIDDQGNVAFNSSISPDGTEGFMRRIAELAKAEEIPWPFPENIDISEKVRLENRRRVAYVSRRIDALLQGATSSDGQ